MPFSDPYRVGLRVWTEGERPQSVRVVLRDASGRTLAARPLAIDGGGAGMLADLVHDFANVPQRRQPVTVIVDAGGAKVWALVSVADPSAPSPALYFPQ